MYRASHKTPAEKPGGTLFLLALAELSMSSHRGSRPPGGIWAAAILVAAAGLARAAQPHANPGDGPVINSAAPRPEPLAIPTSRGVDLFLVDQPDAPRSSASRDNSRAAHKGGNAPDPTPGFVLTSTIVVHAAAIEPELPTITAAGGEAAPEADLTAFWLVSAPSVRAAAALASALRAEGRVIDAYLDIGSPMPLRDGPPTDPGYPQQWHLNNTVTPIADLNVVPAWAAGLTGVGVTVGIVEDGFTTTHPDIAGNYDAAASMTGAGVTSHGTSVAGLIAAKAGNAQGGAGVAYNGKVAKIYRGVTGVDHAVAFAYLNTINAVKTNSWGPADNGIVAFMTPDERAALAAAVTTGRGGLGTVFCWAAGNGGTGDRCDYDPYVSSRYTIAVGAIDDTDARAYYNESGSSMFVVSPSSSDGAHLGIYTTAGASAYTAGFGGTSASSPQAAGVVALMLQANPNLTWRDVKHILLRTARKNDPANPGWTLNGAGHHVSYDYGFGAIDAGAAVALAQTWRNVAPETSLSPGVQAVAVHVQDNSALGASRSVWVASDVLIEAVEVVVNITHPTVGDLRIVLTAPSGTSSLLAVPRPDGTDNYADYLFTTSRCWDEHSVGSWTLTVSDEVAADTGLWNSWQVIIHGAPACRADWDRDGAVDPSDVSLYMQAWFLDVTTGTVTSNFDANPDITPADVSAFIDAWFTAVSSGC